MLKTVSSITNALGSLNYKGTWNASTNTPTLASGAGTKGDYYVVSVAGTTTLDGISNWGVGDWVTYNGSAWQRVEGGANLNGVDLSVSGTATFAAGTALFPAITTTSDTNTGISFPAADTIDLSVGGIGALRLQPSGGVSLGSTVDPGALNFSAAGALKANIALGSGAGFDTSNQTPLIVAPSSNGLLILGSGYFLVAIAEITTTGQNAAYILGNGNVSLLGGTSQWVATTTTPLSSQFSIAYDGTNYSLYNGHTAGTFTFKAAVTKIS